MEYKSENSHISIKKRWRLRSLLENQNNTSVDAENKIKTSKNNDMRSTPEVHTSSQTKFTVCHDGTTHCKTNLNNNGLGSSSGQFTDVYSKFIYKSINTVRNATAKECLPEIPLPPNINILPEKQAKIKYPEMKDEMEWYNHRGQQKLYHFSSNTDEKWKDNYTTYLKNMYHLNPVIISNLYNSIEDRDIPPLVGFVRHYNFENFRLLQYNGNHSSCGADEIKYHLTRRKNDDRIDANTKEVKMAFNQRFYPHSVVHRETQPISKIPSYTNNVHIVERPLVDDGKAFSSDNTVVEHLTIDVDRPHICHICGKTFGQKRYLLNHLSVHSGEKRYLCEICHKNFSHKSNLVKHLKVHSGERPYSCDMCGKRFVQKIHLVNHMTVHSGERPYLCHICQKKFSYKSNLVKHIKLHSGKKPFACDICDKRFTQKVNLVMHQKLHEKGPFHCNICQKEFLYESSLVKHIIAHNGEKPYACNICEKKFIQKANLAKHLKIHKPVIFQT